jgi:hypothetical protein
MKTISYIRWWTRTRGAEDGYARELGEFRLSPLDDVKLHHKTGIWLSELITNDMSDREMVAAMSWWLSYDDQPKVATIFYQLCELMTSSPDVLVSYRIDICESPESGVPIPTNIIIGDYGRNGFVRRHDLLAHLPPLEELLWQVGDVRDAEDQEP